MHKKEYKLNIAGREIVAIFSDLADQAHGSVMLKCEDTVVLATAVMSKDGKNNPGFFNLTVEYLEKFYASGQILGSQFTRREGKPSDKAILASRVIDRTIRPLFSHHIKNAVQVIVTVIAVGKSDPTILGVNAASLAIATSDIPWRGPVGCVHVGKPKGTEDVGVDLYIAPDGDNKYDLDLTVCGRDAHVTMIEAMASEVSETELGNALDLAMKHITEIESFQKKIVSEIGKEKKVFSEPVVPQEIVDMFHNQIEDKMEASLFNKDSKRTIHELEDTWIKILDEKYGSADENKDVVSIAKDYFSDKVDQELHDGAINKNKRADGRGMDEVRPLFCEAGGVSSVLHGTGIFYRGETHVLSVLTLGGPDDAFVQDGMEVKGEKRFMHHYNFPPYSAGETGRLGGINRREMGHGFLAEKALTPVIPNKIDFPYTIRVVSESMASNGSTSQASICASSIALMDGGVPISSPVAGIAMGLMLSAEDSTKYKILTDIQGPEDHYGDMDFKVAGTKNGITAIQLDIKLDGVPVKILKESLTQSRAAHKTILEEINRTIEKPRSDISPNAPKILVTKIKPDQIGMVIGGGGKTVNKIREDTGAEITIEDDGTVFLTGKNGAAEKARDIVEAMTHEYVVGEAFTAKIIKIIEVGAIVSFNNGGGEGLVHISEIAPFRVSRVTDVLKEDMEVPVKVVGVDKERGRISLSIKEADRNFIKNPYPPVEPKKE
ncbi:MAG: polyribonucleotide nucleotidyltransferase [Candidatus Pacebacteria bacterium]|nr:polyribonucleotide nucleotidyltransferase [Candidatus Paceibacterota bacterium]MBP9772231.1 polyribonucleotide nucleotidyltransferase [Candidatus Paceibacterota bacterium]